MEVDTVVRHCASMTSALLVLVPPFRMSHFTWLLELREELQTK